MRDERNLTGDSDSPESASGTSAQEIPIVPPDVIAFSDSESSDDGEEKEDPQPPNSGGPS